MDVHKYPCWNERDHKNDAEPLTQFSQNTPRTGNNYCHLSEERPVKAPRCHVVSHKGTFREASANHFQTSVYFSYQHHL